MSTSSELILIAFCIRLSDVLESAPTRISKLPYSIPSKPGSLHWDLVKSTPFLPVHSLFLVVTKDVWTFSSSFCSRTTLFSPLYMAALQVKKSRTSNIYVTSFHGNREETGLWCRCFLFVTLCMTASFSESLTSKLQKVSPTWIHA